MTGDVQLSEFKLPLTHPIRTSKGKHSARAGFAINIEQDGVVGVGEATPLEGWTEGLTECHDALHKCIDSAEEPWRWRLPVEAPAARHGLQLAVSDLAARTAEQSLAMYLADEQWKEKVPVNATIGLIPVEHISSQLEGAIDAEFPAVKVKIGHEPLRASLARLDEISAYTNDIAIRLDANQSWELETAREVIDTAAEIGVTLIEEPITSPDVSKLGELSDTGVDIALDESLISRRPIDRKAWLQRVNAVVIKPMAIGGIDRAIELVAQARELGVKPILSTTIDGIIARAAAVHVAAAVGISTPSGLGTAGWIAEDLSEDIIPVKDGWINVPKSPGIGTATTINETVLMEPSS